MQNHFDYKYRITYALTSVTLLGGKSDYELILSKLVKLICSDEGPTQF